MRTECTHVDSHSLALMDTFYLKRPATNYGLNIKNFEHTYTSIYNKIPEYISLFKNMLNTRFASIKRPRTKTEDHSELALMPILKGRKLVLIETTVDTAIYDCYEQEGTILSIETEGDVKQLHDLMSIYNLSTALIPGKFHGNSIIIFSPLGKRIGVVTQPLVNGVSSLTLGPNPLFINNFDKKSVLVMDMTDPADVRMRPAFKTETTLSCFCLSREPPIKHNIALFDAAKSSIGTIVDQLGLLSKSRAPFLEKIRKFADASTHQISRTLNINQLFTRLPLIQKLLTSMALPSHHQEIDGRDMTIFRQLIDSIPKVLSRLKFFSGATRVLSLPNKGVQFAPTSYLNGVLRGKTLEASNEIIKIFQIFPHVLEGNYLLKDRYLVEFQKDQLRTRQSVWSYPHVNSCEKRSGKRVCALRLPRDANAKCGSLLGVQHHALERVCAMTNITEPTFMKLPCKHYRLMGLMLKPARVNMRCTANKFEYSLLPGTSLFPVSCNMTSQTGIPLYVTHDNDNPVNRPPVSHREIAKFTAPYQIEIREKGSLQSKVLLKDDFLSFYSNAPSGTSTELETELDDWDDGMYVAVFGSVLGGITSIGICVSVCVILCNRFRKRKRKRREQRQRQQNNIEMQEEIFRPRHYNPGKKYQRTNLINPFYAPSLDRPINRVHPQSHLSNSTHELASFNPYTVR
jgi:hypothetical protein